jgi:hypothetical protein
MPQRYHADLMAMRGTFDAASWLSYRNIWRKSPGLLDFATIDPLGRSSAACCVQIERLSAYSHVQQWNVQSSGMRDIG